MSKEIRLNDKMWFGRYNGKTIKWIIDNDMNFIDKLIDGGKISYHKNILDYLEGGSKYSKKTDYWIPDHLLDPQVGSIQQDEQYNGGWEETPVHGVADYISRTTSPMKNKLFNMQPLEHPARTGEKYVIENPYEWGFNMGVKVASDLNPVGEPNPADDVFVSNPDDFTSWPNNAEV